MKKIITILSVVIIFAFANSKTYTLKEGEAIMLFQALETAQKTIPLSVAITAKESTDALVAIDSIKKVIYKQYSDTTKNK